MTTCLTCDAPMIEIREEGPVFTAIRWVCSKWRVHSIYHFGPVKRKLRGWQFDHPGAGAPWEGVPRVS